MSSGEIIRDGERRLIGYRCEKHGDGTVLATRYSGQWLGVHCPACREETEAATAAEEERSKEQEERRRREATIERYTRTSGIPERYRDKGFERYEPDGEASQKVLALCQAYAERFPERRATGTGLILCGSAGTGKTHLACAIAQHVIAQHVRSVQFVTILKAVRSIKATYSKGSEDSEQEAINRFTQPDLLILDEIGVQFGSDTEKHLMFEIINERYGAMKPTILISNLALDGLTEFVGERVIDRMRENRGSLLVFNWKSKRGQS